MTLLAFSIHFSISSEIELGLGLGWAEKCDFAKIEYGPLEKVDSYHW
jgi:hypothetical protein